MWRETLNVSSKHSYLATLPIVKSDKESNPSTLMEISTSDYNRNVLRWSRLISFLYKSIWKNLSSLWIENLISGYGFLFLITWSAMSSRKDILDFLQCNIVSKMMKIILLDIWPIMQYKNFLGSMDKLLKVINYLFLN